MLSCWEFYAFPYTGVFYFYPWETRKVENRVGKVNEINVGKGRRGKEKRKKKIHHISCTNPYLKQTVDHLTLSVPGIFTNHFIQMPTLKTNSSSKYVLSCDTLPVLAFPNRNKLLLLGR